MTSAPKQQEAREVIFSRIKPSRVPQTRQNLGNDQIMLQTKLVSALL
jgi:hypothetical protein